MVTTISITKEASIKILKMINYPYINMEVAIKNVLLMPKKAGFKPKETLRVYHLDVIKLLP